MLPEPQAALVSRLLFTTQVTGLITSPMYSERHVEVAAISRLAKSAFVLGGVRYVTRSNRPRTA